MISKSKQAELRGILFRHLDGLVTAPSAFELFDKGVLQFIDEQKKCDLPFLTKKFKANEGYLNVALRVLCS